MNSNRWNRRLRATLALSGILVSATCVSSEAHAQAWLPDRSYTEGPGLRVGDLEIHPGVAVRGGYDSNVFKADGKPRTTVIDNQTTDVTQKKVGAAVLAVTPHIHLSTLSDQRKTQGEDREGAQRAMPALAFRGGASATYYQYFTSNAPRNLEVDSDFWLGILPKRPFNIDVNMAYARSVKPFTQNAGSRNAYIYNVIAPRLRFNFGSRSQVLTGYVGYAPRVTLFESTTFNYLNNEAHGVETGAAWRFLPSTALVYDGNVDIQRYDKEDPFRTLSPVLYADSVRYRGRVGMNGALTKTITLRAMAGYSMIAFQKTVNSSRLDDHEDVVGEASLGWAFGPGQSSQLSMGFVRELQSSALGGWLLLDRGSVVLRSLLGRVFLLTIEGGAGRADFGRLWGFDRADTVNPVALGSNMTTKRHDLRLDAAIRGEYRVTNWLSFMADATVQAIVTDFSYAVYYTNRPVPDPAGYVTLQAYGGVRAHY